MSDREQHTVATTPAGGSKSTSSPGRWLYIVVAGLALLIGIAVLVGIHDRTRDRERLGKDTETAAIATVSVISPRPNAQSEALALPGVTAAFSDTPIYARTNGYLKRWHVDIGAHVRQGQLLAEIETPELDQQLEQARADLKTAQSNAHLAQITSERWQYLLKSDSVSKQETDQAMSDASAKAAIVDSMNANVHRLEQLQSFEKIYAPFGGVITARNTDIGALINAGAGGVPSELFHMAAVDRLRVYVEVPEIDSGVAQTGATATLTADEYPGETFTGKIVRDADAIDPHSRTLKVEIDIDNRDDRLRTGAYVFAHFKQPSRRSDARAGLIVPANTLLFRSEGLRVAIERDGKTLLVPITIGRDYGTTVEVVQGLSPTDRVIVNPSDSLVAGIPVRVVTQEKGVK